MDAPAKVNKLFEEVSGKISPTRSEAEVEKAFALKLVERLSAAVADPSVKVYFIGSTARDTGLHLEKDIDLFIAFPKKHSKEEITERAFAAARKAAPVKWEMHYAEHPYLQGVVDGFKVEVIPCFQIRPNESIKSAVDRSPLHMDYLQKRLSFEQKRDVRLLKAMLKRTGVYGAESAVEGFSGLLCEYLILNYRSLWLLLKAACEWRPPVLLDLEGSWRGREKNAVEKFAGNPLVVIDAIDSNRNAAAAVSPENAAVFTALAQAFVKNPSEKFFFKSEVKVDVRRLFDKIKARGTELIAIEFTRPRDSVEDTVFPQARKFLAQAVAGLSREGFTVLDSHALMTDSRFLLFIELADRKRPSIRVFTGPPVWLASDCEKFFKQHKSAIRGPYVKGEKWVAEESQKVTDAHAFSQSLLSGDLAEKSNLAQSISRGRVLSVKELPRLLTDFELSALSAFVEKKPFWL